MCDVRAENNHVPGATGGRTSGPRGADHQGNVCASGGPLPVLERYQRRDRLQWQDVQPACEKRRGANRVYGRATQ